MDKPMACNYYQLYNIPRTFKIANHQYKVELTDFVEDEDGCDIYGQQSDVELVIRIAMKIKMHDGKIVQLTSEQIKNTFWHELFHAFNFYWNNGTDEALAQTFANFMREFELTKE